MILGLEVSGLVAQIIIVGKKNSGELRVELVQVVEIKQLPGIEPAFQLVGCSVTVKTVGLEDGANVMLERQLLVGGDGRVVEQKDEYRSS